MNSTEPRVSPEPAFPLGLHNSTYLFYYISIFLLYCNIRFKGKAILDQFSVFRPQCHSMAPWFKAVLDVYICTSSVFSMVDFVGF